MGWPEEGGGDGGGEGADAGCILSPPPHWAGHHSWQCLDVAVHALAVCNVLQHHLHGSHMHPGDLERLLLAGWKLQSASLDICTTPDTAFWSEFAACPLVLCDDRLSHCDTIADV